MLYHTQAIPDTSDEVFGDCFRTCIACLLNLPLSDVPHNSSPKLGEENQEVFDWLHAQNICMSGFHLPGRYSIQTVLYYANAYKTADTHYILQIHHKSGGHAVIGRNNKIVHDPAPDDRKDYIWNLIKNKEVTEYWVAFLSLIL